MSKFTVTKMPDSEIPAAEISQKPVSVGKTGIWTYKKSKYKEMPLKESQSIHKECKWLKNHFFF